jgi:O-methyltransferase
MIRNPAFASLRPGALLRALLAARGSISAPLGRGWERELEVIRETRRLVPLLMTDARALQVLIAVRAARSLDGAMAEAGVLMGGSARLICENKGDRPLHLFDVFETEQASDKRSHDGDPIATQVRNHFGKVHGVLASVEQLLGSYANVKIHPGLFPSSVPAGLFDERFSFVHLDLDLPECIEAGLRFFVPRLVRRGILLVDDYDDDAVRQMCQSYFGQADAVAEIELPWGQLMVVKTT